MGEIDLSFTEELSEDEKEAASNERNFVEQIGEEVPKLTKKKKKEKERQFNIGFLPISVIKDINDKAKKNGDIRRTFILKALKAQGVDIPDDLLRDRREMSFD